MFSISTRIPLEPYPLFYINGSLVWGQEVANVAIDRTGGANAYVGGSSLRITTRDEDFQHNAIDEYIIFGVSLPISEIN